MHYTDNTTRFQGYNRSKFESITVKYFNVEFVEIIFHAGNSIFMLHEFTVDDKTKKTNFKLIKS